MATHSHTPSHPHDGHASNPAHGHAPTHPQPHAPSQAQSHAHGHVQAHAHGPAHDHHPHHPPHHHHQPHHRGLMERRLLGIRGRYWVITGIVLGLCFSIYEVSVPQTPNAFDEPGAQVPNKLRSPWGVQNPL